MPPADTSGTCASGTAKHIAATANTAAASASPMASFRIEGRVPGLVGHMSPKYGLPKRWQVHRDTDLVDVFIWKNSASTRKTDNLPQFIVMSLGEDHTQGTKPGADAAGLRRFERPGPGPTGRGGQPQQVLAEDRDLRHRRRRPERPRSRRRPSDRRAGDQPLLSPQPSRQHAIRHGQHAADDGVDLGLAATQPVRRRGQSDVRIVQRPGRSDALRPPLGRDRSVGRQHAALPTAPGGRKRWTSASTIESTISS